MNRRGALALPILTVSTLSGLIFIAAAQVPVDPAHAWQFLVTFLGPTGAAAFALWGWSQYLRIRGRLPGQWDEAKFFAELKQLHDAQREGLSRQVSKEVENALTLALKEVRLLLAEQRAREAERRADEASRG